MLAHIARAPLLVLAITVIALAVSRPPAPQTIVVVSVQPPPATKAILLPRPARVLLPYLDRRSTGPCAYFHGHLAPCW